MRFILGSLLLVLLVSNLSPVHGILEAFNTSLKCRCSRTLSTLPNAYRRIVRIEITAPGNGCPNQEIIVRLKNKSAICLNPNSKWTRKFLSELWNSSEKKLS